MDTEYKRVLRFVEKLTEIKSARWLARESGVHAATIRRGLERDSGFSTRTHERLVAWIESVARECHDEGMPLEIEGIELPLSDEFLARFIPPVHGKTAPPDDESKDSGEGDDGEEAPGADESDLEGDGQDKVKQFVEPPVGSKDRLVADDMADDRREGTGAEENSDYLVRCGGCGTLWSCGRCSAEDDGVVELMGTDGAVIRYEGVGPEDVVMPPGVSIAKWRPTELYRSPWEDPDWFDNETVSQDLKVLFGVRMADLIQSRKAVHTGREPWMMPDPYAGPTEADRDIYGDAADVLTEWTHYATAELVMTEVQGYERTNVYRHARMMRLKGEVVLIRQYGMTMPRHELPWDELRRREQLDWRLQEIQELAQHFDDAARPRSGGVFGALRRLFGAGLR